MSETNPSAEALLEGEPPMTDPDEAAPTEGETPDGEPEPSADTQSRTGEDEVDEEESESGVGPGEELSDDELVRAVSALVFASPEPLGLGRLVLLLERPRKGRVKDALLVVQGRLEASGLPLELRQIAGGWRLMTSPDTSSLVSRLVRARKTDKLSPAGLETLAVVAYRQPVTKAEIEAIRGVQCGPMLRNLVDRGLARVTGRADLPGAPLQYGTTKEFLDRFGMASLGDLPRDGELLRDS
jgi:segregation and condensation protein B